VPVSDDIIILIMVGVLILATFLSVHGWRLI